MSRAQRRENLEKLFIGLNITFERLVQEKKQDNSELAFARQGEIVRVKAHEI